MGSSTSSSFSDIHFPGAAPRPDGRGGADIWVATRAAVEGCDAPEVEPFDPPFNAGAPINTEFRDAYASISFDGKTMVFTSDRPGEGGFDLWMAAVIDTSRPRFRRSDCTGDGEVNIADAQCALNWLFAGAAAPGCVAALNTNGDSKVDLADPVSLLGFLFASGPAPVAPFLQCGPGTLAADAELGCADPPRCP